ncbi:8784_t:CDS:2 [Diversispora eburnea]|uniref:8784_t:CDS:1 n=1 Tax=Diversispora eburnea TaxID=1213867 RepID=A0A9N9F3I4_9GLOM|nr:8784_t:CDS:2 [Diversispora eburnea]
MVSGTHTKGLDLLDPKPSIGSLLETLLNLNASKINSEVWTSSENNTNVAETAHSLANHEGKQLKLKKMTLKECELQILAQAVTRRALAEAEALELANLEKKRH